MEEPRVNDVVNNELKAARGGGEQNLTVALRIRPISEDEILQGATIIAHKVEDDMCVLMDPSDDPDDVLRANRSREKQFVFDHIFDGSASQQEVYRATTSSLIPNVISGYNATVFAYGATGAGKTHTMLGSDGDPGIMVRALNDLFLEMEKTSQDMAYKATMSYLEIYNEMIRDLLNPGSGILDLREDARGGVQVAGLSEVTARSTHEIMEMLMKGNRERTSEPTAANLTSSRSHAVLQVTVKQRNRLRNVMQEVRTGKLFLIDLAGSERAANTHNRGKRMVEGAHINRSLLALGNCINALSDKNGSRYINYRDSKLTRLLKDALGGNCKTVMIAHISPASLHFEESRNTLVYADRAKHIKTKVRRNVTDVAYHIAQYTNIISELREEINQLRYQLGDPSRPARGGVANIQAVQSEVLEATRHEARAEMNLLKEQLLTCFKDQMELRKSLMELNNATMEISLETNRNQLVVSEWDLSCARTKREHEIQDTDSTLLADDEKSDTTMMPSDPPDEVLVARNELKVLHDEKRKTEKLRVTVNKELEAARAKTKKLAEMIPIRISNDDQREILNLLTRVHILEIESLETQSSVLYRDYQIKKKDMVITRYRQHRTLCDQIIRRQRDIIDEHKIPVPNDLQSLYDLYKLEAQDRVLNGEESGHSTPELKITSNSEGDLGQGEKFFTPSAKAKHIKKGQEGLWPKDDSSSDVTLPDATGDPREYHQHRRQSPLPNEDRSVIATNTRNIAALAARKRTKVQYDLVNAEKQGGKPLFRPTDDHGALTPSRLAHHNQRYDGLYGLGADNLPSDDNLSSVTADRSSMYHSDLPPLLGLEERHRGRVRRISQHEVDQRRRLRNQSYDRNLQIAQTNAKFAGNPKTNSKSKARQSNPYGDENSRTQEPKLFPNTDGNRAASERGRKKKAAARNKNNGNGKAQSDSSAVSTPQGPNHKEKKALPSISNYRKGDIAVTGYGLPKN